MPITCRPSSPRTFWEHAHWPKAPAISLLSQVPGSDVALDCAPDRSCDFQISLSLTPPCVWAWRWIFWTQRIPEPLTNWAVTDQKISVKTQWHLRWRLGGKFWRVECAQNKHENFAAKFRHIFCRWKTEFRHFPAMTKIKISPSPPENLATSRISTSTTLSAWCLPSHSPIDLYYLTVASPLSIGACLLLWLCKRSWKRA